MGDPNGYSCADDDEDTDDELEEEDGADEEDEDEDEDGDEDPGDAEEGKPKAAKTPRPGRTRRRDPNGEVAFLLRIAADSTQVRVELDEGAVAEYERLIRAKVELPSILLARLKGGVLKLVDGFHRLEAYRRAGRKYIDVAYSGRGRRYVRSPSDALIDAVKANRAHGLRLTNADKRRAVELLLADPVIGKLSANKIAAIAGVDHKTVGKIRRGEQEPAREIPTLPLLPSETTPPATPPIAAPATTQTKTPALPLPTQKATPVAVLPTPPVSTPPPAPVQAARAPETTPEEVLSLVRERAEERADEEPGHDDDGIVEAEDALDEDAHNAATFLLEEVRDYVEKHRGTPRIGFLNPVITLIRGAE